MKIRNMTSRSGNDIPNQFIIEDEGKTFFQSYRSIIAKIENGITYLDINKWDYSRTTAKYRNIFLGEDTKTTRAKIAHGVYVMADLNN